MQNPIIIAGYQRSGTTLMNGLVCADPEANPLLGEATYFRYLVETYARGRQEYNRTTRFYFANPEAYVAFNRRVLQALLEQALALYAPSTRLVLKDPMLTRLVPLVYELVPTAHLLVMVRDPRDMVASLLEVERRSHTQGQQLRIEGAEARAREIGGAYAGILNCRTPGFADRVLFVRYEDLVRNPRETIDRIGQQTGASLDMVDPGHPAPRTRYELHSPQARKSPWYNALCGKPITDVRIGVGQETLDRAQLASVETHCGELMVRFGYTGSRDA